MVEVGVGSLIVSPEPSHDCGERIEKKRIFFSEIYISED